MSQNPNTPGCADKSEGFPLNGIFDPCAGYLLVAAGCGGCWLAVAAAVGIILYQYHFGYLKSIKIHKIHKIHALKIQGRVVSEVAEAPQAATTQTHPAGRP